MRLSAFFTVGGNMRIFIPVFFLVCGFVLLMIYSKESRTIVKNNYRKVMPVFLIVAVFLFLMFALMSVDTWRIF